MSLFNYGFFNFFLGMFVSNTVIMLIKLANHEKIITQTIIAAISVVGLIVTFAIDVVRKKKRDKQFLEFAKKLGTPPTSVLATSNVGCDWCNGSESDHERDCVAIPAPECGEIIVWKFDDYFKSDKCRLDPNHEGPHCTMDYLSWPKK